MVLYDKKSNFLGIGQSELSMLGYEDIEEFKSYHDDFADLFVNHPGYISKFKNFSWIDYSLHSGVPNKNVILKHKNGTDIEAKLDIFEIFLIDEINEEKSIYNIEINVSSAKDDFTTTTDPYSNQKNIKLEPVKEEIEANIQSTLPLEEKISQEPANKIVFDDFSIEDYEEPKINLETNIETENSLYDDTVESFEKDSTISKPLSQDLNIDYEPTIKLKIDVPSDESEREAPQEIQLSNTADLQNQIEPKIDKNIEEDIDLTQIAEDTGMDIEDLALFIGEFIKNSKKISKNLHQNSDLAITKSEIVELKGIASNLKMKNFVKILDSMLINCDKPKFEKYLNKFDIKVKNLENQLF